MSFPGAVLVSLVALLLLVALAAWLLNLPLWLIGAFSVVGVWLIRRVLRRLSRNRARQDTEASV